MSCHLGVSRPESDFQLRQVPRAPFTRGHRSGIEKLEKLLKRGMSDASDLHQIRMINSVVCTPYRLTCFMRHCESQYQIIQMVLR